jgi:cytochrome d ubiquinol oxidase subunit I
MNTLDLARWQFGITTVYHFLMVPLTIGLALVVAWFQTRWYRTGDEAYLRLTKFFGKLFLINFAMGVVTGIVQEFQFGMNWANYSRFVGDVFGAPLAMEALVAFFLESTFLGLWIFGWDRLSPRRRCTSPRSGPPPSAPRLSAYFIIAANSWMQHPVGVKFNPETGRAEMVDIWAVLTNSTTLAAYPHVIAGALMTAAVFVGGISAWLLLRDRHAHARRRPPALRTGVRGRSPDVRRASPWPSQRRLPGQAHVRAAAHEDGAAEALCETEQDRACRCSPSGDGAPTATFAPGRSPRACRFWPPHTTDATIKGVKDLNAQYQEKFGPGDYRPNLFITYWSFRLMILFGAIASFGAVVAWYLTRKGRELPRWKRGCASHRSP